MSGRANSRRSHVSCRAGRATSYVIRRCGVARSHNMQEYKTNGTTQRAVGSSTADEKQDVFLGLETFHEVEKASRELPGEGRALERAPAGFGRNFLACRKDRPLNCNRL